MFHLFNACCRLVAGKRHNLHTMLKQPSATQELRKLLKNIEQQHGKLLKEIEQQHHQTLFVVQQCLRVLETETGEASRESLISRPESSHSKVNAGETNTPLQEQLTHTNKQERTTPSQGHQARKNTTPSQNKAKKTINTSTTKPTTTTKVISKNHVVYYKHTLCIHGKRRDKCKHCGGLGLCQHFRVRSECTDCHGRGMCIHNRRRTRCQECKQAQISVQQSKTLCPHKHRADVCSENPEKDICHDRRGPSPCAESAARKDDSMPVDLQEIEPDCMKSKHSDV